MRREWAPGPVAPWRHADKPHPKRLAYRHAASLFLDPKLLTIITVIRGGGTCDRRYTKAALGGGGGRSSTPRQKRTTRQRNSCCNSRFFFFFFASAAAASTINTSACFICFFFASPRDSRPSSAKILILAKLYSFTSLFDVVKWPRTLLSQLSDTRIVSGS